MSEHLRMTSSWLWSDTIRDLSLQFVLSNVPRPAKMCLRTCADSDHPAHAQSIIRACAPFIHSVVSNDSVSGQWRPWSDCASAQSDQGLHCPHLSESSFSHGPKWLSLLWYCFVLLFYYFIPPSLSLFQFLVNSAFAKYYDTNKIKLHHGKKALSYMKTTKFEIRLHIRSLWTWSFFPFTESLASVQYAYRGSECPDPTPTVNAQKNLDFHWLHFFLSTQLNYYKSRRIQALRMQNVWVPKQSKSESGECCFKCQCELMCCRISKLKSKDYVKDARGKLIN